MSSIFIRIFIDNFSGIFTGSFSFIYMGFSTCRVGGLFIGSFADKFEGCCTFIGDSISFLVSLVYLTHSCPYKACPDITPFSTLSQVGSIWSLS